MPSTDPDLYEKPGGICAAPGRQRNVPCERPAGWGTPHGGYGHCKLHGGNTPSGIKHAEELMARAQVAALGLSREIGPHEALLEEVHRTAGHVTTIGAIVAQLERDRVVSGVTKTVALPDGGKRTEVAAAINIWVRLYQEERAHLVRVSAEAIRCGVAERQVKLAEEMSHRLAAVVSGIASDLGHDLADPDVRKVIRLRLIEGGAETTVEEDAA